MATVEDVRFSNDHRLVQVFLSGTARDPQTYEVHVDISQAGRPFLCDCPGFRARRRCKHVDHVKQEAQHVQHRQERVPDHLVIVIPLKHPSEIDFEEMIQAWEDVGSFRHWVLENGRVEVL